VRVLSEEHADSIFRFEMRRIRMLMCCIGFGGGLGQGAQGHWLVSWHGEWRERRNTGQCRGMGSGGSSGTLASVVAWGV
jgi:hypothetical protein